MNSPPAVGTTRVIPESFEKSLALVRRLLAADGLTVVEEFDMSKEPCFQLGIASRSCIVLLVDTPLLLFEAIALDRSAAVFLPVHVVISGDRDISYVHWTDPVAGSGLRPPAPARGALDQVYKRLNETLSALPETAQVAVPGSST
jgi:uncharacterized protein (DUF302 family)